MSKFLPQLWVPTLSQNCGVCLPRGLEVLSAIVSQAGEGVRVDGRLFLGGQSKSRGDEDEEYGIVVR